MVAADKHCSSQTFSNSLLVHLQLNFLKRFLGRGFLKHAQVKKKSNPLVWFRSFLHEKLIWSMTLDFSSRNFWQLYLVVQENELLHDIFDFGQDITESLSTQQKVSYLCLLQNFSSFSSVMTRDRPSCLLCFFHHQIYDHCSKGMREKSTGKLFSILVFFLSLCIYSFCFQN